MTNRDKTILVGDIGGTHGRFGLVEAGRPTPEHCRTFPISNHASLFDTIETYLAEFPGIHPAQASLAVATTVSSDTVSLTNYGCSFSISQLCEQLALDRLKVVNDFTALALSIPSLSIDQLHQVGGDDALANSAMAVIGPGTGLGVSGLIPTREGWVPLEGEGGHVTLGATNPRELALFERLWQKFGHMSGERLLSGMAMVDVYTALCELDGQQPEVLTPELITSRAVAGSCPVCVELMELFYGWLGVVSGNLALTLGARGGVYIGGGIVPRLLESFEHSSFRRRFEERGRFSDYLKAIPVFVITGGQPALTGALRALDELYDHFGVTES